jgi:probable DNA repair protein
MLTAAYTQALEDGATLVTANARLAREARRAFDLSQRAAGLPAWQSPDILPWGAWLERAWRDCIYNAPAPEPVLLAPAQEQVVWESVIGESPEGGTLLNVPATAAAAIEAYALSESWDLPRRAEDCVGFPDAAAFLGWARVFEERARRNLWLSPASLPVEIRRRIEAGRVALPRRLLYAGFDELAPRERQLLASLEGAGCPVEAVAPPESPSRTVCRAALRDSAEEMLAAARWARARLERQPGARIGVVVPELAAMRAAVERVFDDVLHPGLAMTCGHAPRAFHVSAGETLAGHAVTAAALAILGLYRRQLPLAEIGLLLRSPFLGGAEPEREARALADAELRRHGLAEVAFSGLAARAQRLGCLHLARRLRAWRRYSAQLPARQRAAEWSRAFSRLLHLAGWPGDRPLDSPEYQVVERWNELLSEFAALDTVASAMDFPAALGRLGRLAAGARFAPEDRGAPIQIMGALEAAGASFDCLWVAGLDDRRWPAAPQPNPFLPLPLQRARNIPHCSAERELAYTRRLTDRLLASASEVVLSYPLRDGDADLRPSPFMRDLPEASLEPDASSLALALRRSFPGLEVQPDPAGPPLAPGTYQRGGTLVFERQANCPFRAFAEFRLDARKLEEPVLGLSPQERGKVLHAALENIWRELRTSAALAACSFAERAALVRAAVRAALDAQVRGRGTEEMPRLRALEQQRLERLLAAWLDVDAGRKVPFEVVASERGRRVTVGGLEVDIRVDRIDRLEDGRHVIIDYKSGKPSPSGWEGERPDAPQLPLYASETGSVAAVLFAQLAAGDPRFKGVQESAGIPGAEEYSRSADSGLAAHIGEWRRIIERLAADFAAGNAAVDPKDVCEDCHLAALCRSSEREARVLDDACGEAPRE